MTALPASSTSAYRRVAEELRIAILQGRYATGEQLPTEAELAEQYGVSRQTIRRAFHDLVSERMVYRVPGRGTFATDRDAQYLRQFGSIDDLMNLSVDTRMEVLEPLQRRIDVEAASRLRQDSDVVYNVVLLRSQDDVPFCYTIVSLPPSVAPLLSDVAFFRTTGASSDVTIIGLLDERLEQPIAEAEQSVTASLAPARVAETLLRTTSDPVLRVDRLYFSTIGEPVQLAVSYFAPDHYSYRLRLRRSVR